MQPTREQMLAQLAKTRPGVEIKFENGQIFGFLDFMKNEKNWAVLAYEDQVEFNVKGVVSWKGYPL